MDCSHINKGKLIEIPGTDEHMFGTKDYEPDYGKLGRIAHKIETNEGDGYYYLEFLYCCDCGQILETHGVFTD